MIILKILVLLVAILLSVCLLVAVLTEFIYWYEYKNNPTAVLRGHKFPLWRSCWNVVEVAVSLIVVYLFYPFASIFSKPFLGPQRKKPPLILVHGLYHNASAWFIYRFWLRAAGYGRVHCFSYPTRGKEIWDLTKYLERSVSEVEALYPGEKPLLLGMSLGGLLIRAWMCEQRGNAAQSGAPKDSFSQSVSPETAPVASGADDSHAGDSGLRESAGQSDADQAFRPNQERLCGVVSMGTPHGGSKLAAFALERTAKSLLPSNSFLAELVAKESLVEADWIPKIALYSLYDNMVMPLDNLLPPADWSRDRLPDVTHVAMVMCKRTANKVISALDSLQHCQSSQRHQEEDGENTSTVK